LEKNVLESCLSIIHQSVYIFNLIIKFMKIKIDTSAVIKILN
jgi:hypothetical protein